MKRRFNRAISFLLAFIMTASMVSFDAFAEPVVDAAAQAEEIAAEAEEAVEADSSESTTEAKSEEATTKEASSKSTKKAVKKANSEEKDAKEAIQDGIFKDRDQTTVDLSDYNLSKKEAKSLTNDVLEDSNADTLVTTTYETDDDGNVTTMEVEMDPELELAYDQLDAANENADDSDNEYTIEDVYKAYAEYQKFIDSNPKYFGLTVPYNTQKDAVGTINSMLTLASINPDYVKAGVVPADDLMGMVQLFHQGNQMAVENMGEDLLKAKDEAMKCLDDDMSDVEKLLALNDWLADYCTFDMAYLMDMDAPSQKGHVPTEDEQMQETIAGVWKGNQFGALVERNSVCMGYTAAYAYLVQWAFPEIYAQLDENGNVKKDENGDIVWKSKNEVNYVLDEEGNVKKDEDGTPILNENGYMVDYVRITFDADVTMFGEEQEKFDSDHYWNAVKVNGKWYYVDSAYTDIYIECMSRDRVETDGNMNHLYFMFSDDTTRDLYKKDDDTNFYSNIDTLYKGVATDKTYEDAWFAFAKSPVHEEEDKWYYFYDSTDVIDNMNNYGGMGQGTNSASASKASSNKKAENDYGDIMGQDTEYKLVYHDGSKADSDDSFETLVDFNNGQVYNPETKAMEDNALIKELYAEHEKYVERYPSVAISGDVYDGKFYFNIANCICSYDLNTGKVEKLMEYNDVYANRDLDVALGGMAFTVSDSGTHHVKNNPIASMTIKNGKMYVSIATNFGWISGKSSMYDDSSDGYEFEETNFTKGYNSYFNYNNETNDNDEFMWSANFVDTLDMSHVAGDSHTYAATTVSADCTHDGFTEERCSECGMIKADSRTVSEEDKALGHHYSKMNETYYTKDEDTGEFNTGTTYVCIYCKDAQDSIPEGEESCTYGNPKFEWSKNHKKCTATLTCQDSDHQAAKDVLDCAQPLVETATGDAITSDKSGAESCGTDTTITYTAKFSTNGKDYEATDTKTIEAAKGHEYGDPVFTWSKVMEEQDDGQGGTTEVQTGWKCDKVTITCNVCDHEETASGDAVTTTEETTTEATCTADGEKVFTATATLNGQTYTDTKSFTVASPGHQYDFQNPTFKWADDYSSCKGTLTCAVCKKKKMHYNCAVSDNKADIDYDCEKGATITHTATFYVMANPISGTKDEVIEPKSHAYDQEKNPVQFTWADDASSCKALYTCSDCGKTTDVDAKVEKDTEKSVAPTCTEKGKDVFKATASVEGVEGSEATSEKEIEVAAKGHSYDLEKDPEFTWAEDNKSATATFVCTTCGKEEVKDCEVTEESKDATCTEAGTVTYTATVNFQNKDFTATKTVDEKPLGHNYGKPEFSWTKDEDGNYVVYADFACSRCDDTQHEKCDVTSKTTDATCTEKGETVYTATCEFNGETYTDTKTEEIPAKGHSYDLEKAPTFTWAEDNKSAKATFVCTVCGEEKVEDCKVTSKTTDATCTEDGETVYTATASFEGKDFTDKKTETIKAKGHSYGEPEFEWATADDGSTVAHAKFTCTVCKKDVVDKECTVTHKTTKEPTYVESGVETYTATCEFNGETYTGTRKVEIPKLDAEANMSKTSVTVYATAKSSVLTLSSKYEDDKIVSYKTASTTYASTSRSGNGLVITGKKAGKTSVTVKTASNETIKINVTVKTPSVKLTATKAPLQVKKSTTAIKVSSKISTDAISSVSSSSTSRVKAYRVKTSSGNYSTTGIKLVAQSKTGTATITVKMKSGAKATCKVTVQKSAVKVTSVSVPSTSVTLRLAGANKKTTYKIAAKRYPVTATSKIYYSTSNKKVATVSSSGTITAKKAGKATITVKSGTKTKKITVTVKSK